MKMNRKKIQWMFLVLTMLMALFISTYTVEAASFAGGDGTKSNPYLVKTYAQLKKVKKYSGKYFKQTATIDCGNKNIKKLFGESFDGVYNGNGYSITNFRCYDKSSKYAYICPELEEGSVIKNLTFKNGRITALERAALVGTNNGKLSKVYVKNTTIKSGITYDGLAYASAFCYENLGTLQSCKAVSCSIRVDSDSWLGGSLAASFAIRNSGTIKNCKALKMTLYTNSVQYLARIGGFAVYNNAGGKISNCSLTLAATAYSFGDKDAHYGAYEWGEIGKYVFQNKTGGSVKKCSATGNFQADVPVKTIRYKDNEVHWVD